MTKKTIIPKGITKSDLCVAFLFSLIVFAVSQQKEKTYPINHTRNEWGGKQSGLLQIQRISRYSCLPPEARYFIDSVCDSHVNDIQVQVSAAIVADTVKTKK